MCTGPAAHKGLAQLTLGSETAETPPLKPPECTYQNWAQRLLKLLPPLSLQRIIAPTRIGFYRFNGAGCGCDFGYHI